MTGFGLGVVGSPLRLPPSPEPDGRPTVIANGRQLASRQPVPTTPVLASFLHVRHAMLLPTPPTYRHAPGAADAPKAESALLLSPPGSVTASRGRAGTQAGCRRQAALRR